MMIIRNLVFVGLLGILSACQTTTIDSAPVTKPILEAPATDGVIAMMTLGPEHVVLYDTRAMTREGVEAFAQQYCASLGKSFRSIEHRSIAHPDELPNSGKAGFQCA